MIALTIILNAAIGALWRHTLGGWDGPFKWALGTSVQNWFWNADDKGALSPRRSIILILGWLLSWPLWTALPWWQAAIGTVLCDLFWRFGHKVDSWTIWLRYGPFAISWVLARRFLGDKPERSGDFLNSWMACGEAGAGLLFYGLLPVIAIACA